MNEARFFELTGPLYGPPLTPEKVYVNQVNSLAGYLRFQTEVIATLQARLASLNDQLIGIAFDSPAIAFRARFQRPILRTKGEIIDQLEAQRAIRAGVMNELIEKALASPRAEKPREVTAA